ncbi:hypothetical protein UPYG_G00153910 [Umbra pygmaea]|uniref:Uncharacterized protein n=1 Tax=Umbra pygmaea TaxID=75934 RepID=A0ABD0WXN9_UMBPY
MLRGGVVRWEAVEQTLTMQHGVTTGLGLLDGTSYRDLRQSCCWAQATDQFGPGCACWSSVHEIVSLKEHKCRGGRRNYEVYISMGRNMNVDPASQGRI